MKTTCPICEAAACPECSSEAMPTECTVIILPADAVCSCCDCEAEASCDVTPVD